MMTKAIVLTLCAALSSAAAVPAAEPAPKEATDRAAMTQKHERMAEMHRKAAECLKSSKAVKECHDAMMKDAPEGGFHGDCAMCGHGKGMKGKGMRRGGPGAPPEGSPKTDAK